MENFDFSRKTTKELEERLDYLFTVAVKENKERIMAARALGNLSENSEYDHAKQEQGMIHYEISELMYEIEKRQNNAN